jgi:large subunit ribosomal protein L20
MPRVRHKVSSIARHKKYLKRAKGFWGARSKLYRTAREAVEHAQKYAYRDRRQRKRDFRRLWIARINAAARQNDISYSRMMHGLKLAGVEVNRRMLADLAVRDEAAFSKLAELAKTQS